MTSSVAIAAVSGGSAVLGGLIGAAAGHWTTIRSQKLQVAEDHFRHRQGVYHDFLICAYEFVEAAPQIQPKDTEEWAAWFREFELNRTAILLFGKKEVRTAVDGLSEAMEAVMGDVHEVAGSTLEEKRRSAYLLHEAEVIEAWSATIAAMREDVGSTE